MSGFGANTKQALLPNDMANELPASPEEKADIERPLSPDSVSVHDKSEDTLDSVDSDYNILLPPFQSGLSPDLSATQTMICSRMLQSSGYDTIERPGERPYDSSIIQSIESPRERPRPQNRRTANGYKETNTLKMRERRRSSVEEKKIDLARQAMEEVYEAGWTSSALGLLETWYNKCIKSANDHQNAAVATRKKHVRVAFPSIVVGACATGLAFFSVGDECDESNAGRVEATAISVSLAVLTSALSVLGGLTALFSLSELMQAHMVAASNYQNLARKIQLTLYIPVNLRNSCEACLVDVSAEYNNIYDQAPLLHDGW